MKKKNFFYFGIAVLALVIIFLAAILVNGSSDGKRLSEQLDLGQRYLSELEYEQAVVAFTEAISIDPRSEDAYMGLADAYMGLGDLEAACKALEDGYAATGDERFRERLEELIEEASSGSDNDPDTGTGTDTPEEDSELSMIQFPFALTDIRVMGYDLFDFHYDEIAAAIRAAFPSKVIPGWQEDPDAVWHKESDGWEEYCQRTENYNYGVIFYKERYLEYWVSTMPDFNGLGSLKYDENLGGTNGIGIELYADPDAPETFSLVKEGMVDFPFMPGISEEELFEILQINEIRETAVLSEQDEYWTEYTFLDSSLGKGYYREMPRSDSETMYELDFYLEEGGIFRIYAESNGTGRIYSVTAAYDLEDAYFTLPDQQ